MGSLSEQERKELERLLGKVTEDIEAQGGERIRLQAISKTTHTFYAYLHEDLVKNYGQPPWLFLCHSEVQGA